MNDPNDPNLPTTLPTILPTRRDSEQNRTSQGGKSEAEMEASGDAPSDHISNFGNDEQLLRQAQHEASRERYFVASRLIQRVSDPSLLQSEHNRILEMARDCEHVINELTAEPDLVSDHHDHHGWRKQGESHQHNQHHSNMDTLMYYKVHASSAAISCRIDSTLEESLLIPLLSVFNESDLYATWMPSWKHPKLGVRKSLKLKEMGRGNQVIQVVADMPFPITNRECIMHGCAVDDIDERASIVIKLKSLDTGDHCGLTIPPVEKGLVRVDLDAGMLIRACPADHPVLRQRGRRSASNNDDTKNLLLFSLYQRVDANVKLVPMSLINFFTRTVLGRMWNTLIHVASEVKEGKRPEHQQAILDKPELYEWIAQRVEVMLNNVKDESVVSR